MGVLSRDLSAYQSAVDSYNRSLRSHNAQVNTYNNSIIMDANGRPMVAQTIPTDPYIAAARVFQGLPPLTQYQYFTVDDKGRPNPAQLPAGVDPNRVAGTPIEGNNQYLLARQNVDPGTEPPTKPGEWTKTFDMKAPTATKAQIAREGQPSLAEQEGGLIGDVIQGKGLRYGIGPVPARRASNQSSSSASTVDNAPYDPTQPW